MQSTDLLPIQKMQASSKDNHLLGTSFLHSSCAKIPGVGAKIQERLASLGIQNLQDLLWHLPRDFEDRRRIFRVSDAFQLAGQKAQFDLLIENVQVTQGKIPRLLVHCVDGHTQDHQSIMLVFFKPQRSQIQLYQTKKRVRVFGEAAFYQHNGEQVLQITHPETLFLERFDEPLPTSLTPIYPSTQGLSQKQWRKWLSWLFEQLKAAPFSIDLLNDSIDSLDAVLPCALPSLLESIQSIHQGEHIELDSLGNHAMNRQAPACQRVIIEELIAHQLLWSPHNQNKHATSICPQHHMIENLLTKLPFKMTQAQERSFNEIQEDLLQSKPMIRLLQGDVGSGKTLVAALAAALVATHGSQIAVLAPTEILARQHFTAFNEFLIDLNINIGLFTGKLRTQERQRLLNDIKTGHFNIIIGTHALFQRDVEYHALDLVIIDEQHRFGVAQRTALLEKGIRQTQAGKTITPHQLMMTATPIPRTLTMSVYAQLDTSIIDELPPNRKPVITRAISEHQREKLYERVTSFLASGQQAFWVCAIIQDTEHSGEKKSIEATTEILQAAMPHIRIDYLHGQLQNADKNHSLELFIKGETQLLVATSMVEVGVNIPNANLMIVEDSQNWGLTQLHQLRGRVGRGSMPGYMLLLHKDRISKVAHERLNILRESHNGFEIADKDLEIRGPGEICGVAQSGHAQFKLVDLLADQALFKSAKDISNYIKRHNQHIVNCYVDRYHGFSNQRIQT